jgi:hypothetical protein
MAREIVHRRRYLVNLRPRARDWRQINEKTWHDGQDKSHGGPDLELLRKGEAASRLDERVRNKSCEGREKRHEIVTTSASAHPAPHPFKTYPSQLLDIQIHYKVTIKYLVSSRALIPRLLFMHGGLERDNLPPSFLSFYYRLLSADDIKDFFSSSFGVYCRLYSAWHVRLREIYTKWEPESDINDFVGPAGIKDRAF